MTKDTTPSQIVTTIESTSNGQDTFTVSGLPMIDKVMVRHDIIYGDAFRLRVVSGGVFASIWFGNLKESLKSFSTNHDAYRRLLASERQRTAREFETESVSDR